MPPTQCPHWINAHFTMIYLYICQLNRQLKQNSLARAVVRAPKSSQITFLRSLHWLKIKEQIDYKILSYLQSPYYH